VQVRELKRPVIALENFGHIFSSSEKQRSYQQQLGQARQRFLL